MNNSSQNESTRREFLKSALVVAGAVVTSGLSGCGRKAATDGRVTLTQWYHQYGEKGTKDAVLRYAKAYTKLHPKVAINVVWVPGGGAEYGTKLNTALLVAGGPDVFEKQLSVPMVSAGQVAPLDDLFTPEVRADFDPKDLLVNSVEGKIYAIKMVTDTGVLFYRKSLLAKAGLKPPETLDELIKVSEALTVSRRKGLYLGNDGGVGSCLTLVPWSAGVEFLKDDKVAFNVPRAAKSYEKFRELTESSAILTGVPTDWWDPSALIQGLCAMQWCGLWAYPLIKKEMGDDVGALPWPALDRDGTPSTFLGGWSQMVNSRSENLDEAKKYVRWLWIESRELQQDWNLSYGFHVPPRASVAKSAAALNEPVPAEIVRNLRAYGQVLPPAWSNGMNTALSDAAVNIVKFGRGGDAEIALAAKKCERELERMLRFKG
jgi:multiple sugar transport system substrate-binding protein